MDSNAAPPSPSRRPGLVPAGLLLALLAYAALLGRHMDTCAGGSDSSGYMNNARLLLQGDLHLPQRAIEGLPPGMLPSFAYVPLGFIPVPHGAMVPTYPIGLPLIIAGLSHLTGWASAANVAQWLQALLGVVLMYALARLLDFSRPASALGALLLAGCPLYLFMGLQALSDMPALVWTAAAVYCAWRSRAHAGWSVAAGVAMAVAVLVRPTNLLVLVPVAIALGLSWRRWLGLALGGLPGAGFLMIYNVRLYGRALTTGYGDVSESFSTSFFAPALGYYVHWLPILLTPAVVLLLALPFLFRRVRPIVLILLLSWILVFTGFYAFYFFTSTSWWSLRFILPALPPCILGLLVAGRALTAAWSPRILRRSLVAAAIGVLGWDTYWGLQHMVLEVGTGEQAYVQAARWTQAHLPPRAVVVCMQTSGALLHYTEFTLLRYDFAGGPADLVRLDRACAAAGRPIYAALFGFELETALEQRLPGHWTQVGATRNVTYWRRDGAEPTPLGPLRRELVTADVAGRPVTAEVGAGWYGPEENYRHRWAWSNGHGQLTLSTGSLGTQMLDLSFSLRGMRPTAVTITQNGATLWHGSVDLQRSPTRIRVQVRDGAARLEFASDGAGVLENAEPGARQLAFALYDLQVTASP